MISSPETFPLTLFYRQVVSR